MKKFLLPLLLLATTGAAFGQAGTKHNRGILSEGDDRSYISCRPLSHLAAKSTTLSDTMYYYNNSDTLLFDSSVALKYDGITPNDSGYLFGSNTYGDNAFAEMYDFTWGQDTLINVLGVISSWSGHISPSSNDSVDFHVWGLDPARYQLDTNVYAWNFPGASLGDKKVPLTGLHTTGNQLTTTFFDTPVYSIHGNFYVGYSYEPDSLDGDTIALRSTANHKGQGTGQYQLDQTDTLLITRNAIRESDGYWYDVYNDYDYNVNLSLVPIFQVRSVTGLYGISKSGLTMLGTSPNPAVNNTNINFALQSPATISIQITDLNGRIMNTIEQPGLETGNHSVTIPLTEYAAGNYIYILRSSRGAAMAGIFSIVK